MYTKQTVVTCDTGLHDTQATFFIQKANEFSSRITVEMDSRKINAKSLLGVLSMGVTKGSVVSLSAEGSDETAAVDTLIEMLQKNV